MNIPRGKLAKLAGYHIETVRYCEGIGLMPEPARTENGFRPYSDDEVRRLKFLMRARELGFAVREAQSLLSLADSNTYSCVQVRDMPLGQFDVDTPDTVWVTDITYIRTLEGFVYLAVVIDLYSRRVVGWSLQSRQTTEMVLQALLMAVWRRKPDNKV